MGISQGADKSRLGRVGERLSDHQYKVLSTFAGILINTFVDFAATKPLQEQALYLGLMAGVGALADIAARGDSRSLTSTPKALGINN